MISSRSQEPVEGDVIEIIPMDEYDAQKAKIKGNISWILTKAYRNDIPKEFTPPFYETDDGQIHVKPRLVDLMIKSDLYCQACANMFGESTSLWKGHMGIIQVLSRKGIYVTEPDDLPTAVTETVLMKNAPFQLSAHIALIDALMAAYLSEIVSIERVVKAVRKFASFNASSDLPSDCYEALILWVNKVCTTVQNFQNKKLKSQEEEIIQGETQQKVRIVSRMTTRESICVPLVEDFLQDIGDGCSLAVLISFYCPDALKFSDICLQANVGIADSLYNLRLVKEFFSSNIPCDSFHLTYEDLLYTSEKLKSNFYAILAELFYWFEVQKLPCVLDDPGGDLKQQEQTRPSTAKNLTSNALGNVSVSNVTKQSFRKSTLDENLSPSSPVHVPPRQPLLHRRQQQNGGQQTIPHSKRSNSLCSASEHDGIKQSVIAWEDASRSSENLAASKQSNLLANVSMDSEMDDSFGDDRLSLDLGDSDGNTPPPTITHLPERSEVPSNLRDPEHPDYVELQSVTSGAPTRQASRLSETPRTARMDTPASSATMTLAANHDKMEPLQPARLKPAKEKIINHSKMEERIGKKPVSSPKFQEAPLSVRSQPGPSIDSVQLSDSSTNSFRDVVVTPLSEGQLSDVEALEGPPIGFQGPLSGRGYAAFTVDSGDYDASSSLSGDPHQEEVKTSYTLDQHYTQETARLAGIPVVDSNPAFRRSGSREGSVASSRSSGDFSDHESLKIHSDHKRKESDQHQQQNIRQPIKSALSRSLAGKNDKNSNSIIENQYVRKAEEMNSKNSVGKTKTTSFAEIKKLKETFSRVDNSGLIFMQHNQEINNDQQKPPSRITFQRPTEEDKKISSHRMTWQQTTSQKPPSLSSRSENQNDVVPDDEQDEPSSHVASDIRLKLEEKRKMIERKKQRQEIQQQKMRQKMGKSAFMQVLGKTAVPSANGDMQSTSCPENNKELSHHPEGSRPRSLEREAPIHNMTVQQRIEKPGNDGNLPESVTATGRTSGQRAFSREGIQQTIDNVRKKWFNDDESGKTSVSPPRAENEEGQRDSDEYNSSLDKLNQSLCDLQGEIKRLSLQQVSSTTPVTIPTKSQKERLQERMSASPPRQVQRIGTPPRQVTPPQNQAQESSATRGLAEHAPQTPERVVLSDKAECKDARGSDIKQPPAVPSTIIMEDMPTPERMVMGKGRASEAYPPQSGVTQMGHPYAIANQNQYPSQGQQPYPVYQALPQVPPYPAHTQFLPTPPHGYPQTPPYPQPYPLHHVSPPSQYGMPTPTTGLYGMPGYAPPQPPASTYTVPSLPSYPSVQPPSSHVGAQPFHPTTSTGVYPYESPQTGASAPNVRPVGPIPPVPAVITSAAASDADLTPTNGDISAPVAEPAFHGSEGGSQNETDLVEKPEKSGSITSIGQNGFFVSFGEGSSRKKTKPILGKDRVRKDSNSGADSTPAARSRSLSPRRLIKMNNSSLADMSDSLLVADTSHNASAENLSAVGFVIADDSTANDMGSDEDMMKKKEKLIQLQMRRREDQERKKQYKEIEMARRKEQERLKQEEAEKKKQEEKARREFIFQQYQEKKRQQDEERQPAIRRREKSSSSKPRPKSMHVKTPTSRDGVDSKSTEDLAFTISPPGKNGGTGARRPNPKPLLPSSGKMRKAVSCNTLMSASADSKSLAFGGLTHRRPPSPDVFNKTHKGKTSNDSSETGSNPGSDYSGPKLFVKPSAKSNRHIIINAISHCCLAGSVNMETKHKVLEELAKSDAKHFIILFRDHSCQYRSLYEFYPDTEEIVKIHGIGPKNVQNHMIERFYKYNSGGKSFSEVKSTKHISVSIDAIAIHNSLWKNKPAKKI